MAPEGTAAQFFDGQTAARHHVQVALCDDRQALVITGDRLAEPLRWRLMDLRALSDTSDKARLTVTRHTTSDDEMPRDIARLVILDPDLIAWLHKTRPSLFKAEVHPGSVRKLATYAIGAVVAAGLMLFVILPALAGTLARVIPVEREVAFGKTVTRQMERALGRARMPDLRCSDPRGQAALQKMLTRLTAGQDMKYDINLMVFDHPMINAFAAPGGQVVLVRGLLDKAEHPDEVAGVLAHELAHVENRDTTREALRAAGSAGLLTMILGDFTGGAAIAIVGEHMISASYTRDAEGKADDFALDMLADAGVSAEGFAGFFDRIAELEGFALPAYLSSHPVTEERAMQARDFAGEQAHTTPILTDAEWSDLQGICDSAGDHDGD
ncbi:MAG: M48 family metallopeptidase [Sagittula sp.]|uniref:M48 family metallopeptidase n=1 Tax=Sagittula sp. TaxID=2038081 RepID=UPI004058345D